jgi:5-methylcytosine-specific restriction endonuclease McrA
MDTKLKNFIISLLRRGTYIYGPRQEAKLKARVPAEKHPEILDLGKTKYLYKCANCGKLGKDKEIVMDHIYPVVDLTLKEWDWNSYINRMFCGVDDFQALCKICHDIKTKEENSERRQNKKDSQSSESSNKKTRNKPKKS